MMFDQLYSASAMDFVKKVEEPFLSLPHLPKGVVEFLVKIVPYFTLLTAILTLLSGPLVAFLGSIASLFTLSPMLLVWTIATVVISALNAILLLMAFSPLKNRELKGWMLLFWSQVLNVVASVVALMTGFNSSIISTVVGVVIGLYILFEMKSHYTRATMGEVVEKIKRI